MATDDYRAAFIAFALARGVLGFGTYRLKSGRVSPYFFNAGLFNTGGAVAELGRYYARAIADAGMDFDMLFGPAYKGIPLATATSVALADQYGRDVPYAYNRKEAKDHGEGGTIIGAPIAGRVLVIDDVISAGSSVAESANAISEAGGELAGVVIALDRQECGEGQRSAVQEVGLRYGVPVTAIIGLDDLVAYLTNNGDDTDTLEAIRTYRDRYGVGPEGGH
jgi:orotate phosphoribosyltransferase